MLNQDAADSPLARCSHDPVNGIEPVEEIEETQEQREKRIEREAFRDAATKFMAFMHSVFAFIEGGKSGAEKEIRKWVVMSGLTHPICEGRPDSSIASMLGTTRANFSKHKLSFQRQNSLPPGLGQKSVEARDSYRKSRKSQLHNPA